MYIKHSQCFTFAHRTPIIMHFLRIYKWLTKDLSWNHPESCIRCTGLWLSDAFPVCRCGIALALNKLAEFLDESQVLPLFLFFVPDALNDRHTEVRRCMLEAALSALNTHGKVLHQTPRQPRCRSPAATLTLSHRFCLAGQRELSAARVRGVPEERTAGRQLWLCEAECGHPHGLAGQTSGQEWPESQTHHGQADHCPLNSVTTGLKLFLLVYFCINIHLRWSSFFFYSTFHNTPLFHSSRAGRPELSRFFLFTESNY